MNLACYEKAIKPLNNLHLCLQARLLELELASIFQATHFCWILKKKYKV